MEKRDNWFPNYQEIPDAGIDGAHKLADRLAYYDPQDFAGASVLDVGCNIGQMCFQAVKWGANRVLGVEYDAVAHQKAMEINVKLGTKINFVLDDIDNPFFWNSIGVFDVCLFLSIIDTKELENRYGALAKAAAKTSKVMYFEGHSLATNPPNKYMADLINYTNFTDICIKGTRVDRPFIKCTRKAMSVSECVKNIQENHHKKIAVVGKALAGKTTIRKKLEAAGGKDGCVIVDDLIKQGGGWLCGTPTAAKAELPTMKNVVLFDYRAMEYADNFEVIYFITREQALIGERKDVLPHLRSPSWKFTNAREIHTVICKEEDL